ncbi:class I SAM-dependent methyltransferase [Fimbriiglobus ruber]|uniref:Methyltransferase type 11 n=1 Tax=Fimbriiglobus ruber TaxID=1908690 RepID=A0A225E0Z5_9BACT|nr:methyltransferase domain-containing protein [Fimbriiglobus ruber]OWK43676.1 Methyltransferase type 11 [Fimbriiglobus ruber]
MSDPSASHHESNRHFYDRIANAYDLIADANERAARQTGVKALALKPGEKVLELGFGTGNEVLDLAGLVGPTGQVAGIDISSGMLAVAQRKLSEAALTVPVDLRVGDARALPFAAGAFDAAYTSFTLELFPAADIPVVLAEAKRVLQPGGRIGVVSMATVRPGHPTSALERTYVWMHRHFPHLVDCRPIDTEAVVATAGFQVASVQDLEIWTMPVRVVVGML